MKGRVTVASVGLLVGSFGFLGWVALSRCTLDSNASTRVLVKFNVDTAAATLDMEAHGAAGTLLEGLAYAPGDDDLRLEPGRLRSLDGAFDSPLDTVRISNTGLRVRVSDIIASHTPARLSMRFHGRSRGGLQQDLVVRRGILADGFGVVSLQSCLPRPLSNAVRIEVQVETTDSQLTTFIRDAGGSRALLWVRSSDWLDRASHRRVAASTRHMSPAVIAAVDELCGALDDVMHPALARPLVFLSSPTRELSSHVLTPVGVVLLCLDTLDPASLASAGAAIWSGYWTQFASDPVEDLASLVRTFGAQYLGASFVLTQGDHLQEFRDRLIDRTYTLLADARIRPVPWRATRKANWALLMPGMLALWDAAIAEYSGEATHLAKILASANPSSEAFLTDALSSISDDGSLVQFLYNGRIYGVEGAARSSVAPSWILEPSTPAALPSLQGAPSSIDIAANVYQSGFLETCGCKMAQTGGLARRATVLHEVRANGGLIIDCGYFLSGHPQRNMDDYESATVETFFEGMSLLPLDAICIAHAEVTSGIAELAEQATKNSLPIVCCNLFDEAGSLVFPPHRMVERRGQRIAIIGWTTRSGPLEYDMAFARGLAGFRLDISVAVLDRAVRAARLDSDAVVVAGSFSHRDIHRARTVLEGVELVLTGDPRRPSRESFDYPASRRMRSLMEPYRLGGALVLGARYGPGGLSILRGVDFRGGFQGVEARWLDESIEPTLDVDEVVAALSRLSNQEFSRITSSLPPDQGYVGAGRCATCHPEHYADWRATEHATAMTTLVDARRDRHPSCVRCHVTGYGAERGFADPERRTELLGVQCEVCHGPGERHARTARAEAILRTCSVELCFTCHDSEHSDQFAGREAEAFREVSHPLVRHLVR